MRKMEARLLYDAKASLGEGPVWREDEQALYWVDIPGSRLHCLKPDGKLESATDEVWATPMPIGCFTFTRDNRILAAGSKGFGYLDRKDGKADFIPVIDPESHKPHNRFNDGKCDNHGRFYAGSMAANYEGKTIAGAFYMLEPSGDCRKLLEPVGISNGLAWTADDRTFYYIDTPTCEIAAFDYDPSTGSITTRRTAVRFTESEGHPDGMTIDLNGNLWVCFFGAGRVLCVDPLSGERLAEITVPAPKTTSCCFGGPDYRTLFITTASIGMSEEELEQYPQSGGIFAVRTDAQGAAFPVFG